MEHYNNPDCGCKKTTVEYKKCNKCKPDEPCECAVKDLSTNCIVYTDDDIQCNSTTIITKNLSLTENLKSLLAYICQRFSDLQSYFKIINVGTGVEIYAGDTLLGEKKLRTITSEDDSILVTENADTIDLSVNLDPPEPQNLQSVLDVGDTASRGNASYEMSTNGFETITNENSFGINQISILRTPSNLVQLSNYYTDNNGSNSIQGQFNVDAGKAYIRQNIDGFSGKTINVSFQDPVHSLVNLLFPAKSAPGDYVIATVDQIPTIDGSETKVTAGTNISVSGNGTIATPYVINNTNDGSETKISAGTNVTITGIGTTGNPYTINSLSTVLNSGITTSVSGNGTTATPYTVETVNLQKSISTNYTLTSADNNYSIKANNGSTPITITVPLGLPENFFIGITQKGTADVTLAGASGVTLTNPIGLKIQGQGYYVGVEQIGTSNNFDVLANTKS